jgi:hypothetical protein
MACKHIPGLEFTDLMLEDAGWFRTMVSRENYLANTPEDERGVMTRIVGVPPYKGS